MFVRSGGRTKGLLHHGASRFITVYENDCAVKNNLPTSDPSSNIAAVRGKDLGHRKGVD